MIKWQALTSLQDIEKLNEESKNTKILIFKHSTSCPLSSIAKMRLEQDWDNSYNVNTYYLDLLKYRSVSNEIANRYAVYHESPQVIIIQNEECIVDESHLDISVSHLKPFIS